MEIRDLPASRDAGSPRSPLNPETAAGRASPVALGPVSLHAPVGIGLIGRSGRWIETNRALPRLLGYREATLGGSPIDSLVFPEDRPAAQRVLDRIWSGEIESYRAEQRFVHRDGHPVWADVTIALGPAEDGPCVIVHANDAAARHRAIETSRFLADASQMLPASIDLDELLELLPRVAIPALADWCVVDLAPLGGAAPALFGVAAAEPENTAALRRLRMRPLPRTEDGEGVRAQVLHSGRARSFRRLHADELDQLSDDAAEIALLRTLAPLSAIVVPLTARGRVRGTLSLLRRDAERHDAASELATAEQFGSIAGLAVDNAILFRESRRAERARDDLVAFLGHDLRARLADPAAVSSIDDRLDVLQIEDGCFQVHPEPLALFPLLADVAEAQSSLARSRNISLRLDATEVPFVHADRRRVRQAVAHLVENSLRCTAAGGLVTVRARDLGDAVALAVSDTGRGIPPEELPHLFDRAWQAGHRGRGAGIGMALVKGVTDVHGGRLSIESEIGIGTTVTLHLPAWPGTGDTCQVRAQAPIVVAGGRSTVRVLVATHPAARERMLAALDRQPAIHVIGDAVLRPELLEQVRQHHPDVVLLDPRIPGLDVVETTRRFATMDPPVSVLLLVANGAAALISDALGAGARGFLGEQASADTIVGAVRAVARAELFIDEAIGDGAPAAEAAPEASASGDLLLPLSERERAVLALAAQGFTAAQSGERLNLSPKTVETYRARAMRKLGLSSRAELVRFAIRAGIYAE